MTRSSLLALLSFVFLSSSMVGCSSWKTDSDFDYAQWSDDDQHIAYVKRTFKTKNNMTHIITKD